MAEPPPPVNYEVCVETVHIPQFSSFLETYPEVVGMKFWHGQTLLHKICLRPDANLQLMAICVEAGADVNAVNNFGETPLMFVAKIGSAKMCQYLVEKGGDISAKDKAGRRIIHHAVMGGSVYLVHYLFIVNEYDLDVEDDRKQTSLHISASQGNLHMVKYLLRSGACDAKRTDSFGNTPLHHAAIYGHEPVINALLTSIGFTTLDKINSKGETAMSLCANKGSKHFASHQLLQFAAKDQASGKKYLHPPTLLWFWYLLMPITIFCAGDLLAELVQVLVGWYSGMIVMIFVMLYIVYLFVIHAHRIKHPSKMPNPMHAGAFASGLFGTMITWLVAVLPKLDFDDSNNIWISLMVLCLGPFTFYCYWKLMTTDPGFLPMSGKDTSSRSKMKLQLKIEDSQAKFCSYCDIVASGNVKHCKLCERCVVHMDHHCLFLLRCVASNNHRLFVVFIIAVNIDISLFLFSTVRYFYITYQYLPFGAVFYIIACEHIFLMFIMVLNFLSMFWGITLVQWQLRLISLGYTYYESIAVTSMDDIQSTKSVELTSKERLMNIARFFQGNKTPYKRSTEMV